MKRSHFTAMLVAAAAAFLLVPATAEAGHDSCAPRERLVGYHSCGAPIYLVPRICGYYSCGLPRYSWKREIRHRGCRCSRGGHYHDHHHYSSHGRSYDRGCSSRRYRSSRSYFGLSFGW